MSSVKNPHIPKTAVGILEEFCSRHKKPKPIYTFIETKTGGFECTAQALGETTKCEGLSKKVSKHGAAQKLLSIACSTETGLRREYCEPLNETADKLLSNILGDFCHSKILGYPIFSDKRNALGIFESTCSVNNKRYLASGSGETLLEAHENAAQAMLREIFQDLNLIIDGTIITEESNYDTRGYSHHNYGRNTFNRYDEKY